MFNLFFTKSARLFFTCLQGRLVVYTFWSAAQPTDQGEERVVLLVVVVVVVVGGDHFSCSHVQFFGV